MPIREKPAMKLIEATRAPKKNKNYLVQPYMYQDVEEINAWIHRAGLKDKAIVSKHDLTVHLTRDTDLELGYSWSNMTDRQKEHYLIEHNGKWVLPVQFQLASNVEINGLGSLVGLPFVITGNLKLTKSAITSFKGVPPTIHYISGSTSEEWESFDDLDVTNVAQVVWSAPSYISIAGMPKKLEGLELSHFDRPIEIAQQYKNISNLGLYDCPTGTRGFMTCVKNLPKLEHIYFEVKGMQKADCVAAQNIIVKYLQKKPFTALDCQEELIKNGFKALAR